MWRGNVVSRAEDFYVALHMRDRGGDLVIRAVRCLLGGESFRGSVSGRGLWFGSHWSRDDIAGD